MSKNNESFPKKHKNEDIKNRQRPQGKIYNRWTPPRWLGRRPSPRRPGACTPPGRWRRPARCRRGASARRRSRRATPRGPRRRRRSRFWSDAPPSARAPPSRSPPRSARRRRPTPTRSAPRRPRPAAQGTAFLRRWISARQSLWPSIKFFYLGDKYWIVLKNFAKSVFLGEFILRGDKLYRFWTKNMIPIPKNKNIKTKKLNKRESEEHASAPRRS